MWGHPAPAGLGEAGLEHAELGGLAWCSVTCAGGVEVHGVLGVLRGLHPLKMLLGRSEGGRALPSDPHITPLP